jgi:hypothetical protein
MGQLPNSDIERSEVERLEDMNIEKLWNLTCEEN